MPTHMTIIKSSE